MNSSYGYSTKSILLYYTFVLYLDCVDFTLVSVHCHNYLDTYFFNAVICNTAVKRIFVLKCRTSEFKHIP